MTRYAVTLAADAPQWARYLEIDINRILARMSADARVQTLPKADLPTDGSRALAIVSDEVGGATLAFWDGTAWRRTSDNAVVS